MFTQSERSFRGKLSDGERDDFIFQILAQLNEFNLQLNDLESRISKPNDQEVAVIVRETSRADNGENDKNEEE